MTTDSTYLIEKSNQAELESYLLHKKRAFEQAIESDCSYSSQSSVLEAEVKRKRILNYFCGPGIKQWSPKSHLMIGNHAVTKELLTFRERSISIGEKFNQMNTLRILALSHIFPVDKFNSNRCITTYACKGFKADLYAFAYKNLAVEKVSVEAVGYCKAVLDALDEDLDHLAISFDPATQLDAKLKTVCLQLVANKIAYKANSEGAFIDKYLMPILKTVVLQSCSASSCFSMSDVADPSSPSNKKPDFMLGFKERKREVYFFFVEFKRPETLSKYQPEDDFCKLLKHLKVAVDRQAKLGMVEPSSLGLLCNGFECSLIRMMLVEEGVYLPVVVRKFKLPTSTLGLMDVPRAVECFAFVLGELEKFVQRYKGKAKKNSIKRLVKPSFVTKFMKK